MQEVKAIIYAQEGVSLAVKRSALELYRHEMDKIINGSKRNPARRVLSNVLKWMAGQAAKEKYSNRLTKIELEILQLLVEGMPQKRIALEMGLKLRTIKRHCAQIRRKVNVWSMYQAVAVAVARGWINAPKVDE